MNIGQIARSAALRGTFLAATLSTVPLYAGWPLFSSPCCCEQCKADKASKKGLKDPPVAPVAGSIPAVMIAQAAVAVPPQRIEAAMRSTEEDRLERLIKLLEKMESKPATATAAAAKTPEEKLEELLIELEELRDELKRTSK